MTRHHDFVNLFQVTITLFTCFYMMGRSSVENMFLKFLPNSFGACNFIKIETSPEVFPCKFGCRRPARNERKLIICLKQVNFKTAFLDEKQFSD